jgi:hypothetical protein
MFVNTLTKHVGCGIVVWNLPKFGMKKGGEYIAKDCAQLKNMKLYAQRGSKSILAKMNNLMGEGNQIIVPMKTLFHVFAHGCPMFNYESLYELFASLGVPNNPNMHRSNFASWVFVEFMHTQVEDDTINPMPKFIALSCDEAQQLVMVLGYVSMHMLLMTKLGYPFGVCVLKELWTDLVLTISLKLLWL